MDEWSNLAKIIYKRTYSRKNEEGTSESWNQTVERAIRGNINIVDSQYIEDDEPNQLEYLLSNRKAGPAGRGWWFSGAPAQNRIGGKALCNCWFLQADDPFNYVRAQDLLMLGGGVGLSVEHRFVTKMPHVIPGVKIVHQDTKDADFIVPDSREGWNALLSNIIESYFISGKSFSYSTILVRGKDEPIRGFGGSSSGPGPLNNCINNLTNIISNRSGRHLRPVDAADILCAIADMVVAGNVRRSALIILGDPWDKEFLRCKRFDLGNVPSYRARANFSVVTDDVDDLHPSFWKTYEHGEPFGIVNRRTIQRFGRLGEERLDTATGLNPCAEATLEDAEPCNLQEIWLPRIKDLEELKLASRLMHRWGKRVTCISYNDKKIQEVVERNRRVGTGITGCLQSNLFDPNSLNCAYKIIEQENKEYSKMLGIRKSIRTTVVKPSGTLSLVGDVTPGIHPSYSKFYIRRVRFNSTDTLLPLLREAGHHIEPEKRFDGSLNHDTQVVSFPVETPDGVPCADSGWSLEDQLNTLLFAQKYWSDQAVSCTIYYSKNDIPFIKGWLSKHIKDIKSISFLLHSDHGFEQAPLEAVDEKMYNRISNKITPLVNLDREEISGYGISSDEISDQLECEGGVCPVK